MQGVFAKSSDGISMLCMHMCVHTYTYIDLLVSLVSVIHDT
jgi:hypothetical protein